MKLNLKPRMTLLLAGVLLVWYGSSGWLPAASEQDLAAIKKKTEEFAAADKTVAAARSALLAAREGMEPTRFNSAAYNARVSAQQLTAAKEKYEKAAPDAKTDALEAYELTQEIDAQRKTALADAEKLLAQREAEAKAAEAKFAVALAEAEAAAGQIKSALRQSEGEAQGKLKDSKLAIEKAAFTKANAEQKAAANAAVSKTLAEWAAASKALLQAATAVKQAAENDRAAKLPEAEKAAKASLVALNNALQHLPALQADKAKAAGLQGVCAALIEADGALQKATAAHQQAKQAVDERTKAVKQTEERIKAQQEAMAKRIAKIRAKKDLDREQESLKRAQASKAEAEQALPPKAVELEKAQQAYAAALQAAMKALVLVPEPDKALAEDKAAIAKAIADRDAEFKKENETSAHEAAEAQKAADKAKADLAAAEKTASDRVALRENLNKLMRQRFLRDLRAAQDDRTKREAELIPAERELSAKTTALNRASDALRQAKEHQGKVQQGMTATATALASATKDKQAAEKAVQEKTAAKAGAERAAAAAQAAAKAAKDALAAATPDGKAAAEKLAKDTDALAQAADKKAQEAGASAKAEQAALDKSIAAFKNSEKRSTETASSAKDAAQKVTAAQAAFDKASAEKSTAEQAVAKIQQAIDEASDRFANAKAGSLGGLKPLAASAWDLAKARHLLVRAGFGGTAEEVAKLHAMGLHRAVSFLVDFKKQPTAEIAFAAYPKELARPHEPSLHGEDQRRLREQRVSWDRKQLQEMRAWWLRRMVESTRPLEEKLTLFWHGQIPVQYTTVGDSYYMYLQNQLFRDHAAGNFATLLYGIAHDAAMLKYLNNDTNVKGRANENLAREIMELFSMGRDQGYTEIDIRQGARALTGYTYDPATGQFRFISDRHDTEPKTIFGKTGNYSGDDFVKLILDTPYPAKFIARQLFAFFAHADPSIDTVESLAGVLRQNNYELTPMLENLFLSEEFFNPQSMSTEVKSPVQLMVGLHRDLGLKNPDYAYLATALRDMGQELFEPPSVFGWQSGRSWITTSRILGRYNVLAEVLERRPRAGKVGVDVVGGLLANRQFQSHAEVVDHLVKCVWVVPMSPAKRQALIDYLKPLPAPAQWTANPAQPNTLLTRILVMLMCAPEAQLG